MKKLLLILVLASNIVVYSQELPTMPANGFAFHIGTKFTIMLHPINKKSFDYSIIKIEPFPDVIHTWKHDSLFNEEGQKGTIEFYFCLSTRGDTESEKEKNMQVLLVMKNWTDYSLSYKSDIQTEENGEFKETSNVGIYSGAKGTEMWPYMIYQIRLNDFKIMK